MRVPLIAKKLCNRLTVFLAFNTVNSITFSRDCFLIRSHYKIMCFTEMDYNYCLKRSVVFKMEIYC